MALVQIGVINLIYTKRVTLVQIGDPIYTKKRDFGANRSYKLYLRQKGDFGAIQSYKPDLYQKGDFGANRSYKLDLHQEEELWCKFGL